MLDLVASSELTSNNIGKDFKPFERRSQSLARSQIMGCGVVVVKRGSFFGADDEACVCQFYTNQ